MCKGRGRGSVGDHIIQKFDTLYQTRFRTYKNATPPPNKNLGGEGASDRLTPAAKSLVRSISFLSDDILLWCLYSLVN